MPARKRSKARPVAFTCGHTEHRRRRPAPGTLCDDCSWQQRRRRLIAREDAVVEAVACGYLDPAALDTLADRACFWVVEDREGRRMALKARTADPDTAWRALFDSSGLPPIAQRRGITPADLAAAVTAVRGLRLVHGPMHNSRLPQWAPDVAAGNLLFQELRRAQRHTRLPGEQLTDAELTCLGKTPHSRADAEAAALNANVPAVTYRCPVCRHWHVAGSRPPTPPGHGRNRPRRPRRTQGDTASA